MSRLPLRSAFLKGGLSLALAAHAGALQAATAPVSPATSDSGGLHAAVARPARESPRGAVSLTRRDAWCCAAAVAGVALSMTLDGRVADQAPEADSPGARRFAHAIRSLGNPAVLGPAVVLGWAGGKLGNRPGVSAASVRMGVAMVAAGAVTGALKVSVGRWRPYQAPGDPDVLSPFSGKDSFPSGHTTLAFAAASALDRETSTRWVPFLAYPVAGLVGWSRLRDNQHWLSDVVSGAAIGMWTANKAEDFLQPRARGDAGRVGWLLVPGVRGATLEARMRF